LNINLLICNYHRRRFFAVITIIINKTSSLSLSSSSSSSTAVFGTYCYVPVAKFVFQHFYFPVAGVLAAIFMMIQVFCNMITCRLINGYRLFGSVFCVHLQGLSSPRRPGLLRPWRLKQNAPPEHRLVFVISGKTWIFFIFSEFLIIRVQNKQ
jgi:hypothetical protein